MGGLFNEVNEEAKQASYKIVKGDDNTARVQIGDRKYAPQEISAMVLQKMKQTAEEYLGEKVTDAVITVPDRKSTRLNSSHVAISYAVFCLKKKNMTSEVT